MARERRTIRYEVDVWEMLESHATTTGKTVTAIVNDAIRFYLSQTDALSEARFSALEARLAATESRLAALESRLDRSSE